jgi:hypothetical protein
MHNKSRAGVTPGLRMYAKFWMATIAVITAAMIVVWQLGADGLSKLAHDGLTLYAGGIMIIAFMIGGWSMHGVVRRLLKDHQALDRLESHLRGGDALSVEGFRHLVVSICNDPVKYCGVSRVAHALKLLGVRHNISRAHKVKTPINRSAFHDDFESGISHDIERIDYYVVLYAFLGLVGFTGIIYLTWKGLPVPKTVEQIAEYNRYLLTGLGLTYLLTFLGIGSATLTYVAKHFILHDHSNKVAVRFRDAIFSTVFPVLHSSMAEAEEKQDET